MGRKKTFLLILLASVAVGWGSLQAWRTLRDGAPPLEPLGVGAVLPSNVELVAIEKSLTLRAGDLRGKVLLLNFWAEWCAPCIQEMPALAKLHETYEKRGLRVLGISMDDQPQSALSKLRGHLGMEIPFFMAKGNGSTISAFFSLEGLPFTAIVDRAGVIRFAEPGYRDWMEPEGRKLVEGLL